MRAKTRSRLQASAARLRASAAFDAACSVIAERSGLDAAELALPPRGHEHEVALAARGAPQYAAAGRRAQARAEAIYLTVVALEASVKGCARVAGVAPSAVRKTLRRIEGRRDDPAYDRHLDEIELGMMT